ncbi:MAG: pyridoxamine 5'-phosphate oxidase family protein [Treponema sp.]|jgi:nitroimidazol reductase NimA-like FMN-containing flavoprotein (pyridoxamine 5'-phosphate oxidase superfamily)|nr:pyridoxamine 5'-phosphate oxidase family protein [Treponema sp.]
MEQINYKQRTCTDQEKIERFLTRSRVGVLGLKAGEYPYAVPLNYVWHGGTVYFHGMGSGKREAILREEPPVCFTVYDEYGVVKDKAPWHADTSYFSVMIFGRARKLSRPEESAAVLRLLVEKYMPGFYKDLADSVDPGFVEKYRSALDGNPVAVYALSPDLLSAKENGAAPDELFKPGESL